MNIVPKRALCFFRYVGARHRALGFFLRGGRVNLPYDCVLPRHPGFIARVPSWTEWSISCLGVLPLPFFRCPYPAIFFFTWPSPLPFRC